MHHSITVVGELERNPETSRLPDGKTVTRLLVSCANAYGNKQRQHMDSRIHFRVSVFGSLAEVCQRYLRKGRQVLVEARLNPDPRTGRPRLFVRGDKTIDAGYDLVAMTVRFLGGEGPEDKVAEQQEFDTADGASS